MLTVMDESGITGGVAGEPRKGRRLSDQVGLTDTAENRCWLADCNKAARIDLLDGFLRTRPCNSAGYQ